MLSSYQAFSSIRSALRAAQRHIDNHVMLNEVVEILDPLFASKAIEPDDYIRCIEIFRSLAADSVIDESA